MESGVFGTFVANKVVVESCFLNNTYQITDIIVFVYSFILISSYVMNMLLFILTKQFTKIIWFGNVCKSVVSKVIVKIWSHGEIYVEFNQRSKSRETLPVRIPKSHDTK